MVGDWCYVTPAYYSKILASSASFRCHWQKNEAVTEESGNAATGMIVDHALCKQA
jgi:hypothetical protein